MSGKHLRVRAVRPRFSGSFPSQEMNFEKMRSPKPAFESVTLIFLREKVAAISTLVGGMEFTKVEMLPEIVARAANSRVKTVNKAEEKFTYFRQDLPNSHTLYRTFGLSLFLIGMPSTLVSLDWSFRPHVLTVSC